MSQKTTLRALLGAGLASAMVAASAAGAFATTENNEPDNTGAVTAEVPAGQDTDPTDGAADTDAVSDPEQGEEPAGEPSEDEEAEPTEGDEDQTAKVLEVADPADDEVTEDDEEPADLEEAEDGEPADEDEELVEDVVAAPDVAVTAEGKMDVKAEWTVTKKVVKDTKKVTGKPGGSAKVPYRVEASATGVLSNIKVSGDMTVKNEDKRDLLYTLEVALLKGFNPSEYEELQTVLGSKCSFKGTDADPKMPGFQVWIGSGESLDVSYSCTAPDERVSGPELATAPHSFWAYLKAITAMGFAQEAWSDGYYPVDVTGLEVKDQLVDIYDVNAADIGGDSILLGAADATEGKHIYEYTMNVSIPKQGCYDFDNVALAVNADDKVVAEDNATVEGCAEAAKPEIKPAGVITASSGDTHAGGLAATGAESPMLGAVGAALVGLGALAFGLSRRARKA